VPPKLGYVEMIAAETKKNKLLCRSLILFFKKRLDCRENKLRMFYIEDSETGTHFNVFPWLITGSLAEGLDHEQREIESYPGITRIRRPCLSILVSSMNLSGG
jgi:hypothetical protein